MLALSGINFAKEYDKLMKGSSDDGKPSATLNFKDLNNLSLSLRGGGGAKPPTNPNPPPVIQPETTDKDKLTVEQHLTIVELDKNFRQSFAIAYSIILPILVVLQVFSLVLAFTASAAFFLGIDIIFVSAQITMVWYQVSELEKYQRDIIFYTSGLLGLVWSQLSTIKTIIDAVNKGKIINPAKNIKELIQVNKNLIKISISAFAFAVQLTMTILENNLLPSLLIEVKNE